MKRNVDIGKKICFVVLGAALATIVIGIFAYGIRKYSSYEKNEIDSEEVLSEEIVIFPEAQTTEQTSEPDTEDSLSDLEILQYGKLKFLGIHVTQDYDMAARCFYTVAKQQPEASYALGVMYVYGMGVPIDLERAQRYLQYAVDQGCEEAKDCLERLAACAQINEVLPYSIEPVLELDEDFNSKLLRADVSSFDEQLRTLSQQDFSTAPSLVVFGKEKWLFNQSRVDGNAFADYIAEDDDFFRQNELEAVCDNLKKRQKQLQEKGSQFYILVMPNKETVYGEYMPAYMKENKKNVENRTDQLVRYLKGQGINVIYMKDRFLEDKDRYQIYYKTDTHCNMIGSFIALEELIKGIDADHAISVDNMVFDEHMRDYCGDLGKIIGETDKYSIDTVYFLPENHVPQEDGINASLLLLGDSFGEFLNIEAGYYFKNGVFFDMVMNYNYDYNAATDQYMEKMNPDIVVWELTERYIDRLK